METELVTFVVLAVSVVVIAVVARRGSSSPAPAADSAGTPAEAPAEPSTGSRQQRRHW